MLNQVKSVVYGFSLFPRLFSFVFVGKPVFFERCFSDTYSLALEFQRIASFNSWASARLGRLAQSEIWS